MMSDLPPPDHSEIDERMAQTRAIQGFVKKMLDDPAGLAALERVGLTGDLTAAEKAILVENTGLAAYLRESCKDLDYIAAAVRQEDDTAVALALARRVANAVFTADSPEATAYVFDRVYASRMSNSDNDKYSHLDPEEAEYNRRMDASEENHRKYALIDWQTPTPEAFGWLTQELLDDGHFGEQIRRAGVHGSLSVEDLDAMVAFVQRKAGERGWGPFEWFEFNVIPPLARRIAVGQIQSPFDPKAAEFIRMNTFAVPMKKPGFHFNKYIHIREILLFANAIWADPKVRQLYSQERMTPEEYRYVEDRQREVLRGHGMGRRMKWWIGLVEGLWYRAPPDVLEFTEEMVRNRLSKSQFAHVNFDKGGFSNV
jgi:hypothetical protein